MVRPHLEYANSIWSPKLERQSAAIERVQRRATKLTLLRRSAHRDVRASRPYSKTNMARCALWCLRDDIFEQYLERQLTFRQRQMADLYSREQRFSSVKIYKDLTVFDIEALCFMSQLKNEEPHRVILSSTRVTSGA